MLLIVVPDYASHYFPMSAIAHRVAALGTEVVVATGPRLRDRVIGDGFFWSELRMSQGGNTGVRQPTQHGDDLRPFLASTEAGMVAALLHQADARRHDLLWQPESVAHDTVRLVERLQPSAVLVDHLCVAARLGLFAANVRTWTLVPGHPSQLPGPGEIYGYPTSWPDWVRPDPDGLRELRQRCETTSRMMADTGNRIVAGINPSADRIDDVFGALGATVLYNSPSALQDPTRTLPLDHHFLGSCVRAHDVADDETKEWLAVREPFLYVSLGTFLSGRVDVLRRIVDGLRRDGRRVAIATGSTSNAQLGAIPATWLIRPFLPQIELLAHAEGAICHGGNNTVTEALSAGTPLLILPMSTDQFAIAADVERAGVGVSADPNSVSAATLAGLAQFGDGTRRRVEGLASDLAREPGPQLAARLLTNSEPSPVEHRSRATAGTVEGRQP